MINHLNRIEVCQDVFNSIKLTKVIKNYILMGLSYEKYKNMISDNFLDVKEDQYICDYCSKRFTLKNNLMRHIKKCKCHLNILEDKTNKIDMLKLENRKLEIRLKEYMDEINKLRNMVNDKIHINKNIKCSYKEPNILYLEYNDKKECIYTDLIYIIPLLKRLYFNKKHKENHCISYTNIRSNNIYVYINDMWVLKSCSEVIEELVEICDNIISEFINELRGSSKLTIRENKMIKLYDKYTCNYILDDKDIKILCEYIYMETKNLKIK